MRIWLISDTHFSHENIIKYSGRPFQSAREMDEVMISNWNACVKPSDHIYHLGDVAMKLQALREIVPRLTGKKRLVRGNHDIFRTKEYLKAGFEEIYGVRVFEDGEGGRIILSHLPIHSQSMGRFRANVHGHIHERNYTAPYINISVEQTQYSPVSLEAVQKMARAFPKPEKVFEEDQ